MKSEAVPSRLKQKPQTRTDSQRWLHRDLLAAALLFLVVLGTFWPAIHNDFVGYDDPDYVTSNWHVQQGLTAATIAWAFSSADAANWHPLTWLSHALDWQLFESRAWGHHLTSILLHAASAVLCFIALKNMTNAFSKSFVVALFFGVHPLRVESAAWIAERKDVLSAFFFFLTLIAYCRYVKEAADRRQEMGAKSQTAAGAIQVPESSIQNPIALNPLSWPSYLLTLSFFVLGLMSKPMLVTLPFVLLLLDYWPLRRFENNGQKPGIKNLSALIAEKLPFLVAALAVCIVTFIVQNKGEAMPATLPLFARLENGAISYCRYPGKTFLPFGLAAFYPPVEYWPLLAVGMAVLLLGGVTLATIIDRCEHPYVAVGWFWFIGTLVPVIGLVQVGEQSMADRYSYIPSVGIFIMLAWGVPDLTSRWRFQSLGLPTVTALATLGCVLFTRQQLGYWQDTEHLFRHTLSVTKSNYLAHNNLGVALDQQGRWDEAAAELQQAIACRPSYAEAHKNFAAVLEHEGHLEQALQQFEEALRLKPDFAEACNGIGSVLIRQGKPDEAMRYYQRALMWKPDYADAHFNLALLLQQNGRLDQAISEFQTALKFQPYSADAHNSLGVTLEKQGRLDEAIQEYHDAIHLRPDYARAHFNLGVALSRKGLLDPAIAEYKQALQLKPDYGAAQTNLAILLEMKRVGRGGRE